jgi:prepilin-type N-terminal cleavage/methylation domain-containing protein
VVPQRTLPNRGMWQRPGLSAIELLVSISILLILAALLIPAVQGAREAGRRLKCVANLAEIGVGLQNYCSLHQMFPPSQLKTGTNWSANRMSEFSFLLPFLDQGLFMIR